MKENCVIDFVFFINSTSEYFFKKLKKLGKSLHEILLKLWLIGDKNLTPQDESWKLSKFLVVLIQFEKKTFHHFQNKIIHIFVTFLFEIIQFLFCSLQIHLILMFMIADYHILQSVNFHILTIFQQNYWMRYFDF